MSAAPHSHQTFERLGSFWNSGLARAAIGQARCLAEAAQQNTLAATLQRAVERLTSRPADAQTHRTLQVPVAAVTQTSTTPRPAWEMVLPDATIEPLTIQTKLGLRTAGVDFEWNAGVVTWWESPYDLFELPAVLVLTFVERPTSLWNYPLRLNTATNDPAEVTCYYRTKQDPSQFQRAIAAAAGYTVLPFTSKLLAVAGPRYVFADGVLLAPYLHTPLTVGETYAEGHIIGDMVKVTAATGLGADWYRQLDWSDGLSLNDLTPFPGLRVPDEQRRITTTTQSTAHPGKYHVSAQLDVDAQSGTAVVPAGQLTFTVRFDKAFAVAPLVVGSPQCGNTGELPAVSFVLHSISNFGFSVTFSSVASVDFTFHWKANAIDERHGQTEVPAGVDRVRVVFPVEQPEVPVIAGCLQTDSTTALEIFSTLVSLPDATGFDVLLSGIPTVPLFFNWQIVPPGPGVSRELIAADTAAFTITFAEEYSSLPVLLHGLQNADPDAAELIPYVVTQFSAAGFTVQFSTPPSSDCFFHWEASTEWQNIHARFWQHQAAMEDLTGVFLSDALGMVGPATTGVNLLDLYFTYLLSARGIVVELRSNVDSGPYLARAERFVRSEKPLNAALVLRHLSP